MEGGWHDIAATGDIPVGGMIAAEIDGRAILVCHVREGWFALDDSCTHAAARLHEGWLRGFRLVCPLHGAAFDVRDGMPLGPPAFRPVAAHRVRISAGRVEVALGQAG
jgi:3-phenylpropionate/trans-cinnamate dioxygenase ferredoxin subunit